jgi:hypothetical protein
MTTPPITFIRVRRLLKTVAPHRVQNHVLNRLDGRRKIGDQVMRLGVQANDGCVRQEGGNPLVGTVRSENPVIYARQKILLESADGLGRPQHCPTDPAGVESNERPVPFLDFDDAVFDWHETHDTKGRIARKAVLQPSRDISNELIARPEV